MAVPSQARQSAPASTDARLAHAFALVGDPAVRVLSVDVFDTLLFRRVPDPVDAFELLGARLRELGLVAPELEPGVFRRLRIAAERRARADRAAADGGPEVLLDEIYALLARASVLGPTPDLPACVDAEVELERDLLVPDLDVVALIDAAREHGTLCVGVSDTYFTEAQLAHLVGARAAPLDRLFVSSAHGAGKGGGLWPVVLEQLGVEPAAVLHVGDNEDADVRAPRELGIRTVPFERREPGLATILERERRHLPSAVVPGAGDFGLTALRGKVLHRAEHDQLPGELRPFWRYGAATLGPALTGFAEWVQHRAQGFGATRVHCLMREGALLARMVNDAGGSFDAPVEAQPLWLSRQVLSRAVIRRGDVDELSALLARRSAPTVEGLCRTLDLDAARIPALAPRAQERLADAGLRGEVLGILAGDPELRTHVVALGQQARERVLRLVERVIAPGEQTLVLVDLGWQATTQALLNGVLSEAGVGLHTVGLYLLTHAGVVDRQLDGAEAHGYLGESGEPEAAVRAIIRSPEILEQACMPDHGSQVDLTAELEPVLAPQAEEAVLQSAERHALQQGMLAFQREWVRYQVQAPGALPRLAEGAGPLLLAQVARAVVAPTGEEARVLSSWLHDENFGSSASESVVGGDAARALRHLDARTLAELPMELVYWPYGLAALHDEHLARAAELAELGAVSWEAFGSRLETGDIEVYDDNGWGFDAGRRTVVRGRRNRFGLSFAHARVAGEEIRALRIDPASAPCVVRLDWLALRLHVRGRSEPVEVRLESAAELEAHVRPQQMSWAGPKLLVGPTADPQLHLDVRALAGGTVYAAELSLALAVLGTPPPEKPASVVVSEQALRLRRRVRRLELRSGLPLTTALRGVRGLARRMRG